MPRHAVNTPFVPAPDKTRGVGLRAQLIVALLVVFGVAFALLAILNVQLLSRTRELDRRDVVMQLEQRLDSSEFPLAVEDIRNLEWREGRGAVERMLLLYFLLTGGSIVVISYFLLTTWIVRPLDAVTRASERLAQRGSHVDIPERGAAEVTRLAVAFNRMSRSLQDEREAREARVRELETLTAQLQAARSEVLRGQKLAAVGRLSAGVAHEIGNPLAAVSGLVELLNDDELEPSERKDFLKRIGSELDRVNATIRELLAFARQDSTDIDDAASCDLSQVVADAVSLVRSQKSFANAEIRVDVAEGLPQVRGDASRLRQVLLNLLLNAADAIEDTGRPGTICIAAEAQANRVELRVSDDGRGIAADLLDSIFDPFVTSKKVGQGTGMGLSVSDRIVRDAGGELRAENNPDGGATFRLRLPIAVERSA